MFSGSHSVGGESDQRVDGNDKGHLLEGKGVRVVKGPNVTEIPGIQV